MYFYHQKPKLSVILCAPAVYAIKVPNLYLLESIHSTLPHKLIVPASACVIIGVFRIVMQWSSLASATGIIAVLHRRLSGDPVAAIQASSGTNPSIVFIRSVIRSNTFLNPIIIGILPVSAK